MPLPTSCCGCWHLRLGTFVSCAYSLIYAVVAVGLSAYGIHNYLIYGNRLLSNETAHSLELSTEHRVLYIASCVDLGLYAVLIISTVFVIIGVKRLQRFFFIPYLVTMGMLIVLQFITCLLSVIALCLMPEPGGVFGLALSSTFLVADVICWLCVFYYYRDLREGRAQIRANYSIRVPEMSQSDKTDITIDTSRTSVGLPSYTALCPEMN